MQHFSTTGDSSIGLNTTLYNTIAPHSTSKFYHTVLKVQLTEKDKENIDFVEAFELLQMTACLGLLKQTNKAKKKITDNLTHIMERDETAKKDLEFEEIDTIISHQGLERKNHNISIGLPSSTLQDNNKRQKHGSVLLYHVQYPITVLFFTQKMATSSTTDPL